MDIALLNSKVRDLQRQALIIYNKVIILKIIIIGLISADAVRGELLVREAIGGRKAKSQGHVR